MAYSETLGLDSRKRSPLDGFGFRAQRGHTAPFLRELRNLSVMNCSNMAASQVQAAETGEFRQKTEPALGILLPSPLSSSGS